MPIARPSSPSATRYSPTPECPRISSSASHFLIRLRILHPALAILAAAYFAFAAISVLRSQPRPVAARLATAAMTLALAQLAAGAINMALLAPIAMQLVYLLLADLVWITFVLLNVEAAPRQA